MTARIVSLCAAAVMGCGVVAAPASAASQSAPAPTASAAASSQPAMAQAASSDSRQAAVAAMLKPIPGLTYMPNTVVGVVLSTAKRDLKIEPIAGSVGSTNVYVGVLFYADFAGEHAPTVIKDSHPVFHTMLGVDPNGLLYLVKVKVNTDTNNRSVKLGRAGFMRYTAASTPDTDWVIPTTIKSDGPGLWSLTPKSDLAPGEYGVYSVAQNGQGGVSGQLYGFVVANR